MRLLDSLIEKDLIPRVDADSIIAEASESGESLETILVRRGISGKDILEAKSAGTGIPSISLGTKTVPNEILNYVPEESAVYYKVVPLSLEDGVLHVGIVDPENLDARNAMTFISSKNNIPYKLFVITEEDFGKVLESYKGLSVEVTKALGDLESDLTEEEQALANTAVEDISTKINQTNIIEDAPVTKIVATILRYAIEGEASDVHIEPMAEKVRVRFRLDGALHTSLILPIKVLNAVVARIKILCNMKLDEKRKPQDGRFSAKIEGKKVDFRVSTFPTYYGEKVVMRILDQTKGVKNLDSLDLRPRDLALIREAIKKPYGMILISGPTGSGKTTTLYAMLAELDKESMNVLSLEDPVEYNVEGISQSQVHPEIGYTFANGLRTTLRQDPDVIMVGEIRDKETAQLAVQAALTGHLVLSTIHTNDAVGVIPRLVDMGVDPYLIAPTLVLTMAQRLVSKICGEGNPMPVEGSLKAMIDKQFADLPDEYKKEVPSADTVLQAVSSAECPKGTRGRMGVFEVFKTTKDLERVILTKPSGDEIWKIVRKDGMTTMKEDAIIKALKHEIPFEEINSLA